MQPQDASNPQFQTESKRVPSKSQTEIILVLALLRLGPVVPVALGPLDLGVVLSGVAVAVGVVLIGSGPVMLTSPSSPPTRQASPYPFQRATLDRQELTIGYATIPWYDSVIVEVRVERTVPSVGYGNHSEVVVSVPFAS